MKTHQSKTGESSTKASNSKPFFSKKNQVEERAAVPFFVGKNEASLMPSPFFQSSLVQAKLNDAQHSSSEGLDKEAKPALENFLGHSLSDIKIHNNSAAHEASDLINAKAYTTGNHIFLGNGFNSMPPIQRKALLAHETVHTIQQRHISPHLQAKMQISQPGDASEQEADSISNAYIQAQSTGAYKSAALGMRSQQRIVPVASPVIQRDIKGSKNLGYGKMELDFTKNDAAVAGENANETGTVSFLPDKDAPNSNNIRLIQIVRTVDTSGAEEKDYTWKGEADRNNMRTTKDSKRNIAGGFFIDHSTAIANPRTGKSDAIVSPYFRDYWPNPSGSQDGHKKNRTDIKAASLWDAPWSNKEWRFNFVTSAKAADTDTWYGTALWGFEVYLDAGIAKIKNEYHSFRENRGATTDAALAKFNEFYKNPGTPDAPK